MLTLGEYKDKIYLQLDIYDENLTHHTDDEDVLKRINAVMDKAVKFCFYGKSRTEIWNIVQGKSANAIACQDDIYTHMDENFSLRADAAYAYYFEVDDEATIEIEQDGAVTTITHPAQTGEREFTAFKGLLSGSPAAITFKGGYYNIQNVALYKAQFSSLDRVPDFSVWIPYAIPANLYQIKRVFDSDGQGVDYRISERNLLLRYDTEGEIRVESAYFPAAITDDTPDETEIDVPVENEAIIVDKACAYLTQKPQDYDDYSTDADVGMQMLDSRTGVHQARVVKLFDI
jgi:hypothetical protein